MISSCANCGASLAGRGKRATTCSQKCRSRLQYVKHRAKRREQRRRYASDYYYKHRDTVLAKQRKRAKQRNPDVSVGCVGCGAVFLCARPIRKYCSGECYKSWRSETKRQVLICSVCGVRCGKGKRRYCSNTCKYKDHYARKAAKAKAWTSAWWGRMTTEQKRALRRKYHAKAAESPANVERDRVGRIRWKLANRARHLAAMRRCQVRKALESVPDDVKDMRRELYDLNSEMIMLRRAGVLVE